ncbi:efflux RND transporter periplasmic adaptor subunit [Ruegeria sp.]|uniref:efflux RND transporter periplasmic adaptor subunit n=1 Tax=Ruegeria sp. TaxID=1879320 RepID=UPI00232779B0|nr:efflux RND transporter periplasmic adaptor subunit [Ruegeria sp.]MDA7963508.1 efflux RND transporter periplasmic adaptor subunit [Ruegeria sp.]
MNFRPLLVLPPIALAIAGFVFMTSGETETPLKAEEPTVPVRVLDVQAQTLPVIATGYGRVEAARNWSAISEVEGRILKLAPGLAEGSIVRAGDVLVEIDLTDYEIARQKSLSNIEAARATLLELDRRAENTAALLEVEQRILEVAEAELNRNKALVERGSSTQASLDTAEKTFLAQRVSVLDLQNTLDLFPAQRNAEEANLAVRQAELAEAERAIEKAVIRAPYTGRISEMNVEADQFVRVGDSLLTLEGQEAAEILTELQPEDFRPLLISAMAGQLGAEDQPSVDELVDLFLDSGITAQVSLIGSDPGVAPWDGQIVRLRGAMDSETGAMGLIVRVDDPFASNPRLRRPPLLVGTFVKVTFSHQSDTPGIAVPRNAVQYSDTGAPFVYVVDADTRLDQREIDISHVVENDVFIRSGLEPGVQLVLGSPRPPIIGLKLTSVPVSAGVEVN